MLPSPAGKLILRAHDADPCAAGRACVPLLLVDLAKVVKEGESGIREIARLNRGECFGEMAILDQGSLGAFKLVLSMARVLSQRLRDSSSGSWRPRPNAPPVEPASTCTWYPNNRAGRRKSPLSGFYGVAADQPIFTRTPSAMRLSAASTFAVSG